MKGLFILSFLLAVVAVNSYDTAHDNFEIKDVISNIRVIIEYNHCFLDTGACNEIAGFFKQFIPHAVMTACAYCTPAQRRMGHKYLEALQVLLPEEYDSFKKKFDPQEKYFKAFRAACAEYSE